jgi:GT2 family glycosyltransferase
VSPYHPNRAKISAPKSDYPSASIVIVNYNGYQWLRLFLPFLIRTDYPKFEIIVVDNGSTDQSLEYLRTNWQQYVRVIKLKENLGFAEGCNIGITEANGDIIALLNNDIEVETNWLMAATQTLLSDQRAGAVQSKMMQYEDRKKIDCAGLSVDSFGLSIQIGHDETDDGQYDNLSEIWGCCGGAMIAWKHILIEAGLFDPVFFMYYEDVDLCWRIKLSGHMIRLAPSSVVYHRTSSTSKTIPSSCLAFHITKNYIISWLKNYSLRSLILKCPINFLIIVGGLLFEIAHGRFVFFKARLKSAIWVLRNFSYILNERHRVQHLIRKKEVSDNMLFIQDKKRVSSNLFYLVKMQSQKARREKEIF